VVAAPLGTTTKSRAREVGAFKFIPKPVDFDQLKTQLRQLPDAADCFASHIGSEDRG
jgi:hypothetical protein